MVMFTEWSTVNPRSRTGCRFSHATSATSESGSTHRNCGFLWICNVLSHCVWAIHTSQHISTYLTPSKNAKNTKQVTWKSRKNPQKSSLPMPCRFPAIAAATIACCNAVDPHGPKQPQGLGPQKQPGPSRHMGHFAGRYAVIKAVESIVYTIFYQIIYVILFTLIVYYIIIKVTFMIILYYTR